MLTTFPTRKLWGEHEFSHHRVETFWRCHTCSHDFDSTKSFRSHLQSASKCQLPAPQQEIALEACRMLRTLVFGNMPCPICAGNAGSSRRAFEIHVGRHMEEIALISLPSDQFGESEAESALEEQAMKNSLRPTGLPKDWDPPNDRSSENEPSLWKCKMDINCDWTGTSEWEYR